MAFQCASTACQLRSFRRLRTSKERPNRRATYQTGRTVVIDRLLTNRDLDTNGTGRIATGTGATGGDACVFYASAAETTGTIRVEPGGSVRLRE